MDEQSTLRVRKPRAVAKSSWPLRYLVAALGYGLAIAMTVVTVQHANLLKQHGGDGLKIVGYVLIPLWLLSGTMGLVGSARSGFWFAVSPLLVGLVIFGLANLL